jgi:hypothetical protein
MVQVIQRLLPLLSEHFSLRGAAAALSTLKDLAELNLAEVVVGESRGMLEEQLLIAVSETNDAVFVKVAELFFVIMTSDGLI